MSAAAPRRSDPTQTRGSRPDSPEDELDRSLRPRRLRGLRRPGDGQGAARGLDRGRRQPRRGARPRAAGRAAGPRARRRWRRSSPPSSSVPFMQTAGPALERKGDIAAFLTALEPRCGVLRRRDPPAAAGAGGDLLSGDGGPRAADHRRPGRGRPRRDARPAAVHADRRDDPRRAADDAAARPLRDPAPARALRARGPGDDRAPLGAAARGRDRGRRRARRSRAAAAARRASPTGCSSACATTPRSAAAASSPATIAGRALDLLEVDDEGLDRLDREILRAICEKFGGGPVGLSTLAVAVGEEQDTIEDVYEPYLLQRGLIERTPRGRVATRRAFAHLGSGAARGR